jgi:hypothetical protein
MVSATLIAASFRCAEICAFRRNRGNGYVRWAERRPAPRRSVGMRAGQQQIAADYRQRAARARRGAECVASPEVRDALLRLAATYENVARDPRLVQDDGDVVMFRRVRCRALRD